MILTDKLIKRILIVDDELLILSGLSKALHKLCNFQGEIKTVETAREAIDEISLCFYDICFLDIDLPDLNGLDVMKKINEISPETSIAIITALHIDDDMKRKIEEGASLFIPKPFDISQIKAFVKQALEGGGEERRQFERRPLMKTVNYSVSVLDLGKSKILNLKDDIIDISNAGVGIRTYYPLLPGRVLMFKEGIGHKAGIVKWSVIVDNNCRVGIKFV